MEPYQTKNLYDAKKYDELIALWENEEERNQSDAWDFYNFIRAFYDLKQYERCLEVYRLFHEKYPRIDQQDFSHLDRLEDKMAWSLYYTKVKDFDFRAGDRDQLIRQVEYIIKHSSQSMYSPKWRMVKYMLDHMKNGDFGQIPGENRPRVSAKDAVRYLDMVDPNSLSTECDKAITEEGKTIEKASDMETWYAERPKYLFLAGDYEQCIECCDRALARFSIFHYNNDCWIKYRKAQAIFALGHPDESKTIIKDIQAHGLNHWCLYQLLYEMDINADQTDDALMHAAMCALADPSHEMRVGFYSDYADFLEEKGYQEESSLHRHLILLIRNEKAWSLKPIHTSWVIPEEINSMDKHETLKKLKKFWFECRDKNVKWLTGSIVRLLGEGKSGFVETDDGKSYYFNARDISGLRGVPTVGMKVRFTLMDKLDRSKGVVKPNAVRITIV